MKTTLIIDPNNGYSTGLVLGILSRLGILVSWGLTALNQRVEAHENMTETMDSLYEHGLHNVLGGNQRGMIHDNDDFTYPGDPVQHPLVTIECDGHRVIMYMHCMVVWKEVNAKDWFMARMD